MLSRALLPTAAMLAASAPLLAQYPTAVAIIKTDDVSLGGPYSGQTMTQFYGTNTNAAGGFVVRVRTTGPFGFVEGAYGTRLGDTPPQMLLIEGNYGGINQGGWYDTPGLGENGEVGYRAWSTNHTHVWLENGLVAHTGDPVPAMPGFFYSGFRAPFISPTGEPFFMAWVNETGTLFESSGAALFRGNQVLIAPGDNLPNLPAPLAFANVLPFRASPSTDHYIMRVFMEGLSEDFDTAMIVDGAGVLVGGELVQEGMPVPASVGGTAGETWDTFSIGDVTDNGHYLFSACTFGGVGAAGRDDLLVIDGQIAYRENDVVDGWVLTGNVIAARMNEAGDLAMFWSVDNGGFAAEALFLNDQLMLIEGQPMDLNGDGIPEPGTAILDLPTDGMALTEDGRVVTAIMVDTPGGTETVMYWVHANVGEPFCEGTPNSTGFAADIHASGSSSIGAGDLLLHASSIPTNNFGIFFYGIGAQAAPPVLGDGLLCVDPGGPGLARLPATTSGTSGELSWLVDYGSPPTAATQITAGSSWYFQCWYRDPQGGPAGNNTSNGIRVDFVP